jgi:hypothetical protein
VKPLLNLFVFAGLVATSICALGQTCDPTTVPYSDNFNNSALDSCWAWVREDASHWNLIEASGWLRIWTQQGSVWRNQNDLRNLLVRTSPCENFQIETKIRLQPVVPYQEAAILLYVDDDNYFWLNHSYTYVGDGLTGEKITTCLEQNGAEVQQYRLISSAIVLLRIQKVGNILLPSFSTDSLNWTHFNFVTIPWSCQNLRIGLSAANGLSTDAPSIATDFDYVNVTTGNPLPVSLTTFSASSSSDGIRLSFVLASETDNDHFEIWRSTARDGNFAKIAELRSQGNTASGHNYEYVDRAVTAGQTYWYYLADVDLSGNRTEHRDFLRSTTFTGVNAIPTEFALSAFPNPFNPRTTITFSLPEAGDVHVNVFDIAGRQVQTLTQTHYDAGSHSLRFDASVLPAGVYFVRMESGVQVMTEKVLLLK